MPADRRPTSSILDRVYADLELDAGELLPTSSSPTAEEESDAWGELGDWLVLGERLGADRIFFVHNDPVLVFSTLPSRASEEDIMALYRRAWSMARPRCLFVEVGDELRVYGLSDPPVAPGETKRAITPLEVVDRAANVRSALSRFHGDRFRSGAALEDKSLERTAGRADQRLLRDVRAATTALVSSGLAAQHAHALIERAILVRYLEDRGVLTARYFADLVEDQPSWQAVLEQAAPGVDFGVPSGFIRCLADHDLTYALFEQLAHDFNGDLFVPDSDERHAITDSHLELLRDLLRGVASAAQEPLFLWAYDFSVVPTSLVSTMYELFYHQEVDGRATSTYYTPPELVEFTLADALSPEVLSRGPVVCDPACGSGIFLVEAYRRIVRHEAASQNRSLSTERLRTLLLERVAGCDIDEAAVRLAAFSLYVAFLNYQTPQDIQTAGPLPPLIRRPGPNEGPAPLMVADAFSPLQDEDTGATHVPGSTLPWTGRSFDVVVGNPPWTEPHGGARSTGELWAAGRGLPVGDRSPSQLFLWRALDLLVHEGVAALLVSAKVLFNTRTTSRAFRAGWLSEARVEHVVNFSQVRHDFFEQAVAPFALIRFRHGDVDRAGSVVYETARPVPRARRGSAALARLDRRVVDQRALLHHDHLWKTYSAGDHHDEALLARLDLEGRLSDLLPESPKAQYGYQRARSDERAGHPPPAEWRDTRSLRTFEAWGPIRDEWCEDVPKHVKFDPDPALFLARRLVVRRGVSARFGPQARLLDEPLAFRHTIYGIPLSHRAEWEGKVALGTLLSSLGRYWLYMVSGSWGTWSDEIRAEQLLNLPLRLDRGHNATTRILTAVDELPRVSAAQGELVGAAITTTAIASVLATIDGAIADLFDLTPAERDLVEDFWASQTSDATKPVVLPGSSGGVPATEPGLGAISRYIDVFRRAWRPLLGDTAELDVHFRRDARAQVLAAVFETRAPDDPPASMSPDDGAWSEVLTSYALSLDDQRLDGLLAYGTLRAATDSAIVVVKRNERRLWSPTAARQDAEATTAQVMALQRA